MAVAGGEWHSLALKSDGTVIAWGDNTYGQCNVPEGVLFMVPVAIDIKPGVYPNSINLNSKEKVAVAILSTQNFDASSLVDHTTVTFAAAPVASKDKKGSVAFMVSIEDVNVDGLLDMVLYFNTQALQLTPNSTEAVLTGKTYDEGTSIRGTDSVSIMHKGRN